MNTTGYLMKEFNSFNEKQCIAAIKILRKRKKMLADPGYYLQLRVDGIFIPVNTVYFLQEAGIHTVRDVLEYGWDNIALLKGIGPKYLAILKAKLVIIVRKRQSIKGLTGLDLYTAIATA